MWMTSTRGRVQQTLAKAISMSILYMTIPKIISEFMASTCTIITCINSKAKRLNIRVVSLGPDNLTTHSYLRDWIH